ncbi:MULTISPECIES: SAM hydrolase/SAM-dependent halogenase family protein [Anaerotruncus]|jgi:putative molybdate/tungstate binding protein|uniref:SAM hydrolase/SAM-dependent halogenase family protein n=1 Tax=Anaerotruncus TaxID=244127 RepID=UPI000C75E195|nr:SAM-dependent chlorinase/fluorinase [Anaerotruncus massiliensis (ex Togo et al. 2019)]GKH46666.1 DNA-directed RNA polymerase subunit delta [Oscillospiraceae bacterium]
MRKPYVVFSTDFGLKDGAVCSMYGVVKSIDPEIEMFNLTHEVTKFCTWTASYRLWQSMAFWPKGTIFVSVVDPGVGTPRKACVAKTSNGYYVVTPDNGSLTLVKEKFGIDEVREIDETRNRLVGAGTEDVAIFHGRDLFAYCAGKLAAGLIDYEGVGPAYSVDEIICNPLPEAKITEGRADGYVAMICPNFGCVDTNINYQQFVAAGFRHGDMVNTLVKHGEEVKFEGKVLFHRSFGYVAKGEPIIYNNELNNLDLSLNEVSMGETYGISYGPDWTISIWK